MASAAVLPDAARGLARRPALLAGLLFGLTLALYARTWSFEFLAYDDDTYVTANEGVRGGLSWAGARWALTSGAAANWHPLTWLSHQLDVQLFGLDAGAHHRTNTLLHALNAALVFLALRALTGASARSALVAAFFAWHPLRVEAVAWVAERKELLAAACGLASLWAYAGYARRGGAARYATSLACFALGLCAKPMLVTLPCVFLLLDGWPLARLGRGAGTRRGVWLEKLPFLGLAALSCFVTWRVQAAGGAFGTLERVGASARLANAVAAYGHSLAQTFWPHALAVFHPHPALVDPHAPAWTPGILATLALLVALTGVCLRRARRAPFALVGWLWFLGMLVPVIGLVQVGLQGWAERYTYLPSVGLTLVLVWGGAALARTELAQRLALGLALATLLAASLVTLRQIGTWRNTHTLFTHALTVEESAVAHVQLGRVAEERGDLAAALRHDRRALELAPALAGARVNLARVLRALERPEEALEELERAVADEPDLVPAVAELGWLLAERGRDAEALVHLRHALALASGESAIRNNLAWVLATSRDAARPEEALALAEELVRGSRGAQASHLETLAAALARLGRFPEALEVQTRALARVPAAHRERLAEVRALYAAGQPFLKTP